MIHLLKKFIYCLAAFAGFPFLIVTSALLFVNVNQSDNENEVRVLETLVTLTYLAFPVIIILATLGWHIMDVKKRKSGLSLNNEKLIYYCITSCRYLLSVLIMFYGFQKLINDQLHASYYWYGDELGKLSGYQLTWAFFGHSKFYNFFIAFAQVVGGFLLLFRRTTLLGALFLLPILFNITLINYSYDISAKDIITVLLLMDIFLISISIKPLLSFFIQHAPVDGRQLLNGYSFDKKNNSVLKAVAIVAALVFAFLPNYTNRDTTQRSPFEGAWETVRVQNYTDSIPEKNDKLTLRMFIDGNVATIKKTYQYQDFTMTYDTSGSRTISMVDHRKDSSLNTAIIGNYAMFNNDSLVINGRDGRDSVTWILRKFSK